MLETLEDLPANKQRQLQLLRERIKSFGFVCIAYSGGVDSSLVAAIAQEQLGDKALAVTGVSPSLAPTLLKEARDQAAWIGIRHKECQTKELLNKEYNSNPTNRCFACKKELHHQLKAILKEALPANLLSLLLVSGCQTSAALFQSFILTSFLACLNSSDFTE